MKIKICQQALIFLTLLIFFGKNSSAQIVQNRARESSNKESVFVVAKINNKVITNLELNDRYHFVLFLSKISVNSAIEKKNLLNQIIDKMVDEDLIRQEAANLKIEVTPEEVEDALEMIALQQKKNLTQFKISLIERNISFANYARQVESELAWSKIVSETLRSRVKITDVEVNELFEQKKLNNNVTKFFIAEIFIPEGDNADIMAKKLVLELRNGANFHNIVKQFSRDNLATENKGEIGWWTSQSDIDPKIFAAISKLKKNEYSDPVLLSDGYYIFKVINSKVESKIADNDLSAARNAIFIKKLQTLAKGHLMDLRKKSFVEIDRDKINSARF